MTGQDIQDRLDAIVTDLQTKGKGQTVTLIFRNENNDVQVFQLSSTPAGDVDAAQLSAVQQFINPLKISADSYTTNYAPVQSASEAFRIASLPHQALMDAAKIARDNLTAALEADADYQTAKTALDTARTDAAYIQSSEAYKAANVSENYSELQAAKGKYTIL